jgi:hypothetical protein
VAEQRDDTDLRQHPSYDPTTGTFVLDRNYQVPDFSTSAPRRARLRRPPRSGAKPKPAAGGTGHAPAAAKRS